MENFCTNNRVNMKPPAIRSDRLILRPLSLEDEAAVINLLTNADFMVNSPSGALDPSSAKSRFYLLRENYPKIGYGKFAVILRASGDMIGYCGVEFCEIDGTGQVELGFRLIPAQRGHGYATEAGRAYLAWFDEHFEEPVIAFTDPANHSSINVLHKLGFRRSRKSVYSGMPVVIFER